MDTQLAQQRHFPVGFTAASLRPELARIVAEAYLASGDWEQAKQLVLTQNLLQARSPASGVRMERELRQRLQTLTPAQLALLAHAPADDRRAMAWLAVLKYIPLVYALAADLLRGKLEHLDPVLRPSDYEAFFETQVAGQPALAELTPSTRNKIQQVIVRMLREVGIVSGLKTDKGLNFSRPVVAPDAWAAIVADHPCWLAGFLVPDDEIKSLTR